jgi:hypothetical protein
MLHVFCARAVVRGASVLALVCSRRRMNTIWQALDRQGMAPALRAIVHDGAESIRLYR